MKAEKIKGFFKSTKGKITIGVICGIIVGAVMGSPSDDDIAKLASVDILNSEVDTLKSENEELKKKIEEAKPFFEMKEDERKAEIEKAKKEKEEAEKKAQAEREEAERKEREEAEKKKADEIKARTKTLSNGNYIAGKDFEAGTYDIVAISGGGNVSSDNMFSGGINAVMGVKNDGFYEKEYKNISLPTGVKLTIDGVKIKLIPTE